MKIIVRTIFILSITLFSSAQILFLNENGVDFGMGRGEIEKILEGKYRLKQIESLSASSNSKTYALDNLYEYCKCRFEIWLNFESNEVLKSLYLAFQGAEAGVFGEKEYKLTKFANPEPVFTHLLNCMKEKYGEPKPHGPIRMAGIKIEQWDIQNTIISVYWSDVFTKGRVILTFEK
jgi:hypothetical protein